MVDDQTSLPEVAAERLVGLARAGLPVVIYGRPPTGGVGFKGARGEDAAVRTAIRRLRRLSNVRAASSPGALLRALRRLAVGPDFSPRRTTSIVPVHRHTAAGDVWFLYNDSPRRARAVVSFATSGAPTEVDLWTGRATRLGGYVRRGRRVTLPVSLAAGDTALLTFDRSRARGSGGRPRRLPGSAGRPRAMACNRADHRAERRRPDRANPSGAHRLGEHRRAAREVGDRHLHGHGARPARWLRRGRGVLLDPGAFGGGLRLWINGRRVAGPPVPGESPTDVTRPLRAESTHSGSRCPRR